MGRIHEGGGGGGLRFKAPPFWGTPYFLKREKDVVRKDVVIKSIELRFNQLNTLQNATVSTIYMFSVIKALFSPHVCDSRILA